MTRKRLTVVLLFPLLILLAMSGFRAFADDNDDLRSYLAHGTWYQEIATEMGTMAQETVFNRDGTVTALAQVRGTPYHQGGEGRWDIRDGIHWFYYDRCSPDPCAVEKEGTWIKVIGENHLQDKLGDAYRE